MCISWVQPDEGEEAWYAQEALLSEMNGGVKMADSDSGDERGRGANLICNGVLDRDSG